MSGGLRSRLESKWEECRAHRATAMPKDIAAGGCSTGPQTRSAGQVDPDTFRILETIKDRGAFIKALGFCGDRAQDDPHAMRGRERRAMANGVRFGAKSKLNPYQREQARRMLPDGQSQRAVGTIARRGSPVEFSERPANWGRFHFARKSSTSPPRQQRQNRAPTVVLVPECSGRHHRWARERSASEGQVADATW